MTDPRSDLERESRRFVQPDQAFERLIHRRAEKRLHQRITAGVVGILVFVAVALGAWLAVERDTSTTPGDDSPVSELGIFAGVRGWIAYGDLEFDQPRIWAIDPANPDAQPVLLDSDGGLPVAWSSDGSKLLIARGDRWGPGPGELVVLNADGTATRVAHASGYPGGSFTPDGSQVVYGAGNGIYSVSADGGSPRLLYDPGDLAVWAPVLSPNGSRLAFFEGYGDGDNRLWVMNVDGTDRSQILGVDEAGRTPWTLQWSPDGTRLAFTRSGGRSVGIVNADGSGNLVFVDAGVEGTGPYWSQDGSRIAFGSSHSLAIGRPDGTELQEFSAGGAGPWNPLDPVPAGDSTSTGPVSDELVLRLHSWRQGYVEVAVYADGRVIWVPSDQDGYLQMRLSPEGVEWLRTKAVSTGLFEHNLALGVDLRWGDLEVNRGGRSVIVAWGKTGDRVGTAPMRERFAAATPAQADSLVALEAFFRDPLAWALPPEMYVQPEVSPFVPTHLWVGWDRSVPDPSRLPPPAREVLTTNLQAVLDGSCGVITIAQAQEIADAMEQAGLIAHDDVTDGIEFDMPGQGSPHSLFHAHPALPDESTCD